MTIRPIGKARKRTRPKAVGGQVDDSWAQQEAVYAEQREQLKAELRVAEERLEHSRRTLLDDLQSGARRIIEEADGLPEAVVEDARSIILRIIMLRDYEQKGLVRDAWLEALQIGGAIERIKDSELMEIARREMRNYAPWRGIAVRVEPLEARIWEFMYGRTEVDLAEFYRACWSKPFNREQHCGKVRKALSVLTAKFSANDPPIRVQLNVRDGRVVLTEGGG